MTEVQIDEGQMIGHLMSGLGLRGDLFLVGVNGQLLNADEMRHKRLVKGDSVLLIQLSGDEMSQRSERGGRQVCLAG